MWFVGVLFCSVAISQHGLCYYRWWIGDQEEEIEPAFLWPKERTIVAHLTIIVTKKQWEVPLI